MDRSELSFYIPFPDLTRVHKFDTVESGHTQRNFRNVTLICILSFGKAALTSGSEETESVLLNLGNAGSPRVRMSPGYRRYKEKPSQREGTNFKMCVINVRSLASSICSRWSQPPCPNLIGSVNLNQLVIYTEARRKKKRS